MEYVKFIFDSAQNGAAWGLFAFSLIINAILFNAVRLLYKNDQHRQDQVQTALGEIKTAIANSNVLLQILVGKRR